MIRIEENYSDASSWDNFVESQPESRFCQLHGYAQAADVYGYKSRHICFSREGEILAVLPVSKTASLLFGRRLVSQPFSEYGGMLLSSKATSSDIEEIFGSMREVLAKDAIAVLELHGQGSLSRESLEAHLLQANTHQNAVLDLSPSLDELWRKVLHHQVRKTVRQAEDCNLHVWQECSPQSIKNIFYPLYLRTMRRLGVPPHSVEYFLRCHSGLRERIAIFWAAKDGVVIAALLGFCCGGRVNITTTVSDEVSWEYRPNDLLHWSYIKWAKEQNMRYFDFGSVRYAGQMQYKKKWGCSFNEHAYYLLHSARHQSETRVLNTSGDTMKKFSAIWSRYVPDSMGKAIGPVLRKHLVR